MAVTEILTPISTRAGYEDLTFQIENSIMKPIRLLTYGGDLVSGTGQVKAP